MSAMWWTEFSAALAPWLMRMMVGGLAVSLLALLTGAIIPRDSAATRVVVLRTAVVAMLLLPVASFVAPWQWTLPVSSFWISEGGASEQITGALTSASTATAQIRGPLAKEPGAAGPADGYGPTADATPSFSEPADPGLAVPLVSVWALVAASVLAYFGVGLMTLRLHARRAHDVTVEVAHLLPLKRRVRVLRGGPFAVPGCWGVVRPSVLLPRSSNHWTRSRLRAVLLHETAHLERRDPLFLLLARTACALHWANPFAWQLQRMLLSDGEAACDADVIDRGVPAREYAHVLVELAAEASAGRPRLALTMSRPGGLSRRITDVLGSRRGGPIRSGLAVTASVLLVMAALVCATASIGAPSAHASEAAAANATTATPPAPVVRRQVAAETGAWDATYDGGDELYVQLVDGAGGGMSANHVPLTDLQGVDAAFSSARGEIEFELARPAGTVLFEGRFDGNIGRGTYRFAPRADFAAALRSRGIEGIPPVRLLLLALQNVDLRFVDDLFEHTAGPVDGDLLVRAAIFAVDAAFIQEMAAAGYPRLGVQDLVRLKIFEIDSTYVENLRDEGTTLTVDEMVSRRIQERKTPSGNGDQRKAAVSRTVDAQITNEVTHSRTATLELEAE